MLLELAVCHPVPIMQTSIQFPKCRSSVIICKLDKKLSLISLEVELYIIVPLDESDKSLHSKSPCRHRYRCNKWAVFCLLSYFVIFEKFENYYALSVILVPCLSLFDWS